MRIYKDDTALIHGIAFYFTMGKDEEAMLQIAAGHNGEQDSRRWRSVE
jgi:hypothetical protein